MRRSSDLLRLYEQLRGRIGRLQAIERALPALPAAERHRQTGYVTIEAVSVWSSFCREFVLSCLLTRAKSMSGRSVTHRLSSTPLTERDALVESIRAAKNPAFAPSPTAKISPADEPDWKAPHALSRIAVSLSLSNIAEIQKAFSRASAAFTDLPTLRNFYAHKDKGTYVKIARLATTKYKTASLDSPTTLLTNVLPSRSDTLLAEWLADIRAVSADMCG